MHDHPAPRHTEPDDAPANDVPTAPPDARRAVAGAGSPMPTRLRLPMERAFGEDFTGVRLHTDGAAREGVVRSHARALTLGRHIALGPGAGAEDSPLLAHELAHVVQQRHASGRAGGGSPALEREADHAADQASRGGRVALGRVGTTPPVLLAPLRFGAGRTLVVVDNGAVTVNGVAVRARADADGLLRFNNREIVLDRSGLFRYRDRYTVCMSCNPDYYELKGGHWVTRAGVTPPETAGSFYDTSTRTWMLRQEPVVTQAVLAPQTTVPAGPVNPALQQRVQTAQQVREQYEARVQDAMVGGRSRADAEALVRSRMQEAAGPGNLGTFESGQTYAVVEDEIGPGVTRRTTTGAVAGGETPTVAVPAPQLRARLAAINTALGENFVVNDQTLNHAEVRAIVRTPQAGTYYVNRDMCPVCQRFFAMEARAQNRVITVVDPSTVRVFSPDLRITEYHQNVVYERSCAITRAQGVSSMEIADHPSVTYSVRTVPRTSPLPPPEVGAKGTAPRSANTEEAVEPHGVPRAPQVRPGVVEPEGVGGARGIRVRGGGIRRFALTAGRLVAEGVLFIALLIAEIIIQLIVIPWLERLRRRLEEKYRKLLQQQIQDYYTSHLATTVQNRVLRQAERLREIEDREGQPYVNTSLAVHFERAFDFWTGPGHGPPESITDLNFVSMDLIDVQVDDAPVKETSDPLKADDPSVVFGDSRATEWSQNVQFPAIPPSYQDLVNEFGANPASRARSECFIATACYGTPSAPAVETLRSFRDLHLLGGPRRRGLVDTYYRCSPPVADFLTRHAVARATVRLCVVAPAAALVRLTRLDRYGHPWLPGPTVSLTSPRGVVVRSTATPGAPARGDGSVSVG